MAQQSRSPITDPKQWAHTQWNTTQLKDARRTKRAVQLGAAIASNSAGSLPQQTHRSWGDLKAAYRLLNESDVTYTAVCTPHWEATRSAVQHSITPTLFIQDTTTFNFSSQRSITGLGYTGDACGHGCEMQSCMVVIPDEHNPEIIGLAHQTIWTRPNRVQPKDTQTARRQRRTEADIWAETLEAIGVVPEGAHWVSVGDRGSDVFSYIRRAKALSWDCLLRVTQDRVITTADHGTQRLKQWIRTCPAKLQKHITLRGRSGKRKQAVTLEITWEAIVLQPPQHRPDEQTPIPGWIIRCWNAAEDMEWILFSTVPITDETGALTQVSWYEHRWLIEEYHKCLKTGCAAEDRQLMTAHGLFALFGFLSITAVRLLQLRQLARSTPDVPAEHIVDPLLVKLIAKKLHRSPHLTVKQFWHGVAKLGGFIGRKSDGEPGWQTIWKGWNELSLIYWGAEWMREEYEKKMV